MAGSTFVVGSVGVIVRPILDGFNKQIRSAMTGGLDSIAREASTSAGVKFVEGFGKEARKGTPRVMADAGTAAGESFGNKINAAITGRQSLLGKTLTKAVVGSAMTAGTVGAATLGTALFKGWNRLAAIDQAQAKLRGLGHDANSVKAIMDDSMASVKGTAFGLDEAATTSAKLVASGIKPGADLRRVLGGVADSATIAGVSMTDMGQIWSSVASRGKLQGDDAMQLMAAGIPVWQLVGKQMNVTAAEAQDLASKGEVSFEVFAAAMNDGMGGSALEAGNTAQGAIANVNAALGRFGASILSGVFPQVAPALTAITAKIDVLGKAVEPVAQAFSKQLVAGVQDFISGWSSGASGLTGAAKAGQQLRTVLDQLVTVTSWLWEHILAPMVGFLSDHFVGVLLTVGAVLLGNNVFGAFFKVADAAKKLGLVFTGIGPFIGSLGTFFGAFAAKITKVVPLFRGIAGIVTKFLVPGLKLLWGVIIANPVVAAIVGAIALIALFLTKTELGRQIVAGVVDWFKGTALPVLQSVWEGIAAGAIWLYEKAIVPAWEGIKTAVGAVVGWFENTLVPAFQRVWRLITQGDTTGLDTSSGAVQFFLAIRQVATGFISWVTGTLAPSLASAWSILTGGGYTGGLGGADSPIVGTLTKIRETALGLIAWVQTTAIPFLQTVGTVIAQVAAWLWTNGLKVAFDAITIGAGVLWTVLQVAFTTIGTVLTWLWTVVDAALGGIAWLITNVVAPVAIWLWQYVIVPAFQGIALAVGVAITVITAIIQGLIWTWQNVLAPLAIWLWQSVLVPAWNGIQAAITAAVSVITAIVTGLVWTWQNVLAPVALWLWNSVILPAWEGIRIAVALAVATVLTIIDGLIWAWQNLLAPTALWLWNNVIVPVWQGIQAAISAVVQWFQNTAWPLAKTVIDFFAGGFNLLWEIVKLVWAWIKSAIDAVVAWFRDVAWPIAKAVIDFFAGGFKLLWSIVKSVWQGIRDAINSVVAWFRDTAWPVISGVIDNIKRGFDVMRSAIGDAWSWIKDKAINPVATWFRDTIKPMFDSVTDGVADAFNTLKSTVETAWNGIRDTAKAPIRFLVQDIIRDGIVAKYNEIAGTFKVPTIDTKKFTVGFRKGGILPGFTPMHRGDDVLTPMRSGEGVLVSEGLRDRESRGAFLAANAAARRGVPFSSFLRNAHGYAGGGITEIKKIATDMGLRLTSSYRPGARTAQTGSPSLHATEQAWDFAGPADRMMAFFNKIDATFSGLAELLYSPAGSRNIHRGGKRYANTGKTLANHFNHVHVGIMNALGAGSGGFSLNPFEGLWNSLQAKVREGVGDSPLGNMLFEIPKKMIDDALEWAKGLLGDGLEIAQDTASGVVGAARWTPVATQALVREGIYDPRALPSLLRRMGQESGYNPKAINDWDSNAKKGTPSKGLMQVIQPTFNRYRDKSLSSDIYDPLANIVASIRYARDRYGSPMRGWDRKGGYAAGGIVKPTLYDSGGIIPPGLQMISNQTRKPEAALTADQLAQIRAIASGRTVAGDVYNISVPKPAASAVEIVDELTWHKRLASRGGRYAKTR